MRKRVLSEGGKFTEFSGERTLVPVKSGDKAVAERKELEKVAEVAGISPNNPEAGGLSAEDREKVGGAMSIPEMKALAKMRGVAIPSKVKKNAHIRDFLLREEEVEL